MIEAINNFIGSSSWTVSILLVWMFYKCIKLARLGWIPRLNYIKAAIYLFWGVLYIMSSVGYEPFLAVQRTFFRLATVLAFSIEILILYEKHRIVEALLPREVKDG